MVYRHFRRKYILAERHIKYAYARIRFLTSSKSDRSVILMGEKDAHEARDNSFALFCHLIDEGREDVYYVIRGNSKDIHKLDSYKHRTIIFNSLKHFIFIFRAKLLILNDGFIDVYPTYPYILRRTYEPFLYLQHGIFRYKTVFFSPAHYYGRIIRFVGSLTSELEILVNRMASSANHEQMRRFDLQRLLMGSNRSALSKPGLEALIQDIEAWRDANAPAPFADALIKKQTNEIRRLIRDIGFPASRVTLTGLPRHDTLKTRDPSNPTHRPRIYVFFTWRDYWPQNVKPKDVFRSEFYCLVRDLITNPAFVALLSERGAQVEISLHQKLSAYLGPLQSIASENVVFKRGADDMKSALRQSDLLITDYSSVALDFCLAGIPVVFYQPDLDAYESSRGSYVDSSAGWVGPVTETLGDLVAVVRNALDGHLNADADKHRRALLTEYPSLGKSCAALRKEIDSLPPRITFVCYNIFGIGGTVSSVTNIANYLFERGYQVDIISLRRTSKTPELGLNPSIRVTSLLDFTNGGAKGLASYERLLIKAPSILCHKEDDLYSGASLLTDVRLAYAIRRCTSDVIIPTFPSAARITLQFRRRKSAVLLQEHKFFSAHSKGIQDLIRNTYVKSDGILALTNADAHEYSTITGKPVFVVPNGVPGPSSKPLGTTTPEIKRIVALGRLDRQKQFNLLVQAFSTVHHDFPEWRIFIYGQGSEAAPLTALIRKLGLQQKVFLKGPVKGASKVIGPADICAVTSTYEGFGMVFIEAYAAGKPVVTFDIERGPKEIVVDGLTGLKAQPFDVDDYAAKLRALMASEQLRSEIGANAKALFLERFDINVTGEQFEAAIASVLQQRDLRSSVQRPPTVPPST